MVFLEVNCQELLLSKALVARDTHKGFLPGMRPLVHNHVALLKMVSHKTKAIVFGGKRQNYLWVRTQRSN